MSEKTTKKTAAPKPTTGQGKNEETAVAKRGSTALAAPGLTFERDAGAGFEGTSADSFAIPYLIMIQKTSPQVDDASGKYIKGAKPGQFLNTVTNELFDEADIIPVAYKRAFVNWRDRNEGGGFLGSYDPNDPIVARGERNESGKLVLDDGSYLADTRYHFALLLNAGSVSPVIVALASTQIKKSRLFMSLMNGIKLKRADGSLFTPPTYSHVYKLTSINESNDKGSWKGIKISLVRILGKVKGDVEAYQSAKLFKEQIESGAAKVGAPEPEPDHAAGSDDEGAEY